MGGYQGYSVFTQMITDAKPPMITDRRRSTGVRRTTSLLHNCWELTIAKGSFRDYNKLREELNMPWEIRKYIIAAASVGILAAGAALYSQTDQTIKPPETTPETPPPMPQENQNIPAPEPAPAVPSPSLHDKTRSEPHVLQEKTISEFCLKFIAMLNDGNFKEAFRYVNNYSIMKRLNQSNARSIIIDMVRKAAKHEKCLGVEILLEKKAGNFAKEVICTSKYPSSFLMFDFIFYSPASEDKWKLYDLTITDNIEALFSLGGTGTY